MTAETIKLEYNLRDGEKLEYKTHVISHHKLTEKDKPPVEQSSTLDMSMFQICKGVDPQGLFMVDVIIQSGKIQRDGKEEPLPNQGQTVSMKMKKDGEITNSSENVPYSQPPFPKHPVKQGDTWTGESKIDIEGKPEPVVIKYNYTLIGFEKISGYTCAVIEAKSPDTIVELEPGVNQKLIASGKTYFAHSIGRLVKSIVETDTIITAPEIELKTNIKVEVALEEKGGEKTAEPKLKLGGSEPEEFFIR